MGRKRSWGGRGSGYRGGKRERRDGSRDESSGGADGTYGMDSSNGGFGYRKTFEGAHAGSYAGELSKLLSEEQRKKLEAADSAAEAEESGDAPRKAKKKVAVLLAYCGTAYQGMQINLGARTVEAELELAMYLAGGISRSNFGNLQKVGWSRAARTDKGVHAAAQVVAMRLAYNEGKEEEMQATINQHLPEDIRVLDIRRVQNKFDAKNACDRRRYVYIMPTAMMASRDCVLELFQEAMTDAREVKTVVVSTSHASSATTQPGTPHADQSACKPSLAARATPASQPWARSGDGGSGTSPRADDGDDPEARGDVAGEGGSNEAKNPSAISPCRGGWGEGGEENIPGGGDQDGGGVREGGGGGDAGGAGGGTGKVLGCMATTGGWGPEDRVGPEVLSRVAEGLRPFRITPEDMEALRRGLNLFVGTKNFHNFTSRKKAGDPSCHRYIISFEASDPWVIGDGSEWVQLTVVGQSFLLNQIRKMAAVAIDLVRKTASIDDFNRTFTSERLNLNIAPSEGLFLDRPIFEKHNEMLPDDAQDRMLSWATGPHAESLEAFKKEHIYEHIVKQEQKEHNFIRWLGIIGSNGCTYKAEAEAPSSPATAKAARPEGAKAEAGNALQAEGFTKPNDAMPI